MKLGLIGYPLGHSWSKPIHDFMIGSDYQMNELEPEKLEEFITALNKTLDVEDVNRKLSNLDRLQALETGLGDIKAAIADKSALTDVSKAVREGNAKIEDLARRPIVIQRTGSASGGTSSTSDKPRRGGIWPFRRK